MAFAGPLEDRIAIRSLNESYADAVFRRDAAAWAATWAEDAAWNLMGMSVTGRDAILQLWLGAMANYPFAGFFVQPGSLAVTGDVAEGVVYTQEVLEKTDGTIVRPIGCYHDVYVRHDGQWLFQRRSFEMLKGQFP
jgi:uncharacterized protein (TIGR02246 family)